MTERRGAWSLSLAKVISYEDLEEVRTKCAVKKKATASKGKRGHKRKTPAPESGVAVAPSMALKLRSSVSIQRLKVARMY